MKENTIKAALIEDDLDMCKILAEYLAEYGIELYYFRLPENGIKALETEHFDVLILDLSLPQMDGLEVCKIIKERTPALPIIITSARSAVSDRALGLELGADDYLPKPFDPRELVARIRAHSRRIERSGAENCTFTINEHSMEIFKENRALQLTPAEFEALKLLIENPNAVLSRDQIVDSVESMRWASVGKSVDVIISRIRQKIGDDSKNPKYIKAVKGFGYKFIP